MELTVKVVLSWAVVMASGLYGFKLMSAYEEDKQRIKMKKRQAEERKKKKELQIDL